MFNDGQEVAMRVIGEEDGKFDAGDVVLFFGQGVDTRYTDTNVYWLTYGGAAGLRMRRPEQRCGRNRQPTSFFPSVKKEDNLVYDSNLPELSRVTIIGAAQTITAAGVGKTGFAEYQRCHP